MKTLFKILITFAALALLSGVVNAQDKSTVLKAGAYYYAFSMSTSDVVSNTDTTFTIQVLVNKDEPVKYSIKSTIEENSGTANTVVYLQGKIFSGDSWSAIDTVTYTGTGTDTTFTFTQTTTAPYYRYFRMSHDAVSGTTQNYKITLAQFKFWSK